MALAGNSGGQSQSGIYFEVRDQGEAKDPASWLQDRVLMYAGPITQHPTVACYPSVFAVACSAALFWGWLPFVIASSRGRSRSSYCPSLAQIRRHYVEDIDEATLAKGAIDGMLAHQITTRRCWILCNSRSYNKMPKVPLPA